MPNCLLASTVHAVKPTVNFTDDFSACVPSHTVQYSKMTRHIKRVEYVTEHQDKQTTKTHPKNKIPITELSNIKL